MKKLITILFAAFALACLSSVNLYAQPRYNVTVLPLPVNATATGLNDLGEVIGYYGSYYSYYYYSSFLYSNGTITNFGEGDLPADINDHSQVVGLTSSNQAFLYSNGIIVELGSNYMEQSSANAINNAGQIVGNAVGRRNESAVIFWQGNIISITGAGASGGYATSINDNYGADGFGQIVGQALFNEATGYSGFLYSNGVMVDIGPSICLGTQFFHINNIGQIVGYCSASSSSSGNLAFIYNTQDESYIFIGNIQPALYIFGPPDINDAGQVVGTLESGSPFLYMDGITYNLIDLILPNYNFTTFTPIAINNRGQILGNIIYDYGYQYKERTLDVLLLTPVPQPPTYTVIVIPATTITNLNNLGDTVGYATVQDNQQAFLRYANGTTTDLGTLGGSTSMANAINDARQVVGQSTLSSGNSHAFIYYTNGTMADLGTLAGSSGTSVANAINRIGQIVGQSSTSSSSSEAVLFWKGQILGLGTLDSSTGASTATSINNAADSTGLGQIVGQADSNYGNQAFLYSNKTMTDIGHTICPNTYSSSEAVSTNDIGQIAGNCYDSSSSLAFVYDIKSQKSTFIGTGGSKAADINNAGQVVGIDGTTPFFFADGVEYNLYDYIPSSAGITGLIPVAINNQGQIAANSDQGGVLLTTASE